MERSSVGSPIRQVRLSGRSAPLDPRVHAVRADLADIALAGAVTATRYVEPVLRECRTSTAMLRSARSDDAVAVSALLPGERFRALELTGDWAWGTCVHDGYVGFVRTAALGPPGPEPTHRVRAPAALVFPGPDIKLPPQATLPLGAPVAVAGEDGGFAVLATGGYVRRVQLAPRGWTEPDLVATAEAFLGAPYLWGGRTRDGIDCSGLAQAAVRAAGLPCPRDSDQQRASVGEEVAFAERRRGDLVFFPGHVGILADPDRLLHANAYWMTTLVEPLADVIVRLVPTCPEPVLAVRRVGPAIPAPIV